MPNKQVDEITFIIDDVDIEKINQFNILGFTIILYLNWSKHIDNLANRCSRTIAIKTKSKHIIQTRIQITLCNSVVLPHSN